MGDVPGTLQLYVPRYRNFVYDGLAPLDERSAREWLSPKRMWQFDPKKLSIDRYDVNVRTLDSFGLTPDVVKIDVQGFELAVVKGGAETFRRSHPATIVECPSPELVDLFAEWDMQAYRCVDGQLIAGDTRGSNTLFLHPSRRSQLDR